MMRYLHILLLLTPFFLHAQIDRSFNVGFVTHPEVFRPAANGQWLIGGIGYNTPSAFYDTLFLAVLDADGGIQQLIRVKNLPPSETYRFYNAFGSDDGNFFIHVDQTLCDVSSYIRRLRKIDPEGNMLWERNSMEAFPHQFPHQFQKTPTGDLLGLSVKGAVVLDAATGNILQNMPMDGPPANLLFSPVFDNQFFFSRDDNEQLQFRKLDPANNKITLLGSTAYSGYYWNKIIQIKPNLYLGQLLSLSGDYFYWINTANGITLTPFNEPTPRINDFTVSIADSLILMLQYDEDFKNIKFRAMNLSGEPVNLNLPVFPERLHGEQLALNGNQLAICGFDYGGYGTGPGQISLSAWTRLVDLNQPSAPIERPDAALTAVENQSDIQITSGGVPLYHSLNGGNFRVQITNNGPQTLNSVQVNISFPPPFDGWICPAGLSAFQHYDHLNLAPGASTWLQFGDLNVYGQASKLTELCFWLTSPNTLADDNQPNDTHCFDLTTSTQAPTLSEVRINPNPATNYFTVDNLPESAVGVRYELTDLTGKVIISGVITDTAPKIETGQLPAGLYLFRAMGRIWKVVYC